MVDVDLFGLDIAQIVADVLDGQVVTMTLTRKTRSGNVDGSITVSDTDTYTCQGIIDSHSEQWANLLHEGDRVVLVLTKTMKDSSGDAASIVPKPGDQITDDQTETLDVLGILERDPAAATFLLRCR